MTAVDALRRDLDACAARNQRLRLWWRDDDLQRPGEALDRLLDALGEHAISPALAAIPHGLEPAAVAALDGTSAALFVHGWCHANHAPADEKKSEFGPHRPLVDRLAEVERAWTRLQSLAGGRAVSCFVPPWNRLGDDLAAALGRTGMTALSAFAAAGKAPARAGVPRLDTHVDLIDWRGGRRALPAEAVAAQLVRHVGVDGPVGILSHHRDTGGRDWAEWHGLFSILGAHPAVQWLSPTEALASVGCHGVKRRPH